METVGAQTSGRKSPSSGNEAQEKYQCPRCPSSFKRPEHLKRHQRSHDGHKPFVCSTCLKRFFRSDILARHELMHLASQRNSTTASRRRACTECARSRERCSRDEPCTRCSTKFLQCLYPDDAPQKPPLPSLEPSTSSSQNEQGQLEEHPQSAPQSPSLPAKREDFPPLNPIHREPANDDTSLRYFIHTLRSPPTATSSLLADPGHSPNLLYKHSPFHQAEQPISISAFNSGKDEPSTSERIALDAGRQVSLFDQQPASSAFARPRTHDPIALDEPSFGDALREYMNICPLAVANPSRFGYLSEALGGSSSSEAQAGGSSHEHAGDPFLALHHHQHHDAGQQQQQQYRASGLRTGRDGGDLGPATGVGVGVGAGIGAVPSAVPIGAAPPGVLLPPPPPPPPPPAASAPAPSSDFGPQQQPINLRAYEVIASHFGELCLERGTPSSPACSNNISEAQRTAQHEFFVKLYYEHFKRDA